MNKVLIFIFLLGFTYSCNLQKIETNCLNDNSLRFKRKIYNIIDSAIQVETFNDLADSTKILWKGNKLKKVISSTCNDGLLEVTVNTKRGKRIISFDYNLKVRDIYIILAPIY